MAHYIWLAIDCVKPKSYCMKEFAIIEQIESIKKATVQATKSKESAIKFLTDAGIIEGELNEKKIIKKKK